LAVLLAPEDEENQEFQFVKTFDMTEGQFEALTFENGQLILAPMSELIYLIRPMANSLNILAFTAETVVYLLETNGEGKFTNLLLPTLTEQSVPHEAVTPICVEACYEIVPSEIYLLVVSDNESVLQTLDLKNNKLIP
jgi:hypothetical protein